jgi:hypothetical protein
MQTMEMFPRKAIVPAGSFQRAGIAKILDESKI